MTVTNLPSVRNAIETRLRGPRDHAKRVKKEIENLSAELAADETRIIALMTKHESLRQMYENGTTKLREDQANLRASRERLQSLLSELEHRPAEYEEAKEHRDQRLKAKQGEVNKSQSPPCPTTIVVH